MELIFLHRAESPLELAQQVDALSAVLGDSLGSVQLEQLVGYHKISEVPFDQIRQT